MQYNTNYTREQGEQVYKFLLKKIKKLEKDSIDYYMAVWQARKVMFYIQNND